MLEVMKWLPILIFSCVSAVAQTQISGVVNIYTPVLAIPSSCGQDLYVESSTGFKPGDRVVIMQMKGAAINTSDSPQFGDVIQLGSCGNVEFASVKSVVGRMITLNARLVNTYDVTAAVQLIRVAEYTSAVIAGTVRPQPWNGRTGGVVVIEASGTLTFNADIDASGSGFRGGARSVNYASCSRVGYIYPMATGFGAQKGEGIADWQTVYEAGRGKLVNGGGGGVDHNSGGGGGSNAGAGGRGGDQYTGCGRATTNGGMGGAPLPYARNLPKIYLGGGGGGGHQNNNVGTNGANGGGIVIIRAGVIMGNAHVVNASGSSVVAVAANDAGGGGGAGGAVWIDCPVFASALTANVQGGAGGSANTSVAHGVGGGGGGGVVLSPLAARSPMLQLQLQGASTGYNIPFRTQADSNLHAEPGSPGLFIEQFQIPEGAFALIPITVVATPDTTVCRGAMVACTLRARGGTGNYQFQWRTPGGQVYGTNATYMATVTMPMRFIATVTDDRGCVGEDTITFETLRAPQLTIDTVNTGVRSSCRGLTDTVIVVRNIDTVDAIITSATPTSANCSLVAPPVFPLQLQRGDSLRLRVRFGALPVGPFTVGVNVRATSCDTSLQGVLRGTIATVDMQMSPDTIHLVQQYSCMPFREFHTLYCTNNGSVDATITSIEARGAVSVVSPAVPLIVRSGKVASILLDCQPTTSLRTGDVVVHWSAAGCSDSLQTHFTSTFARGAWSVSDSTIDLGHVLECEAPSDTIITIYNKSDARASFYIEESGRAALEVLSLIYYDVGPHDSLRLKISLRPVGRGLQLGQVRIIMRECNDTAIVNVRLVVDSVAFIVSDSVRFDTLIACRGNELRVPVTFRNNSSAGVRGVITRIDARPPFSITHAVGDTIDVSDAGTTEVIFTPTQDGAFRDSIVIELSPCAVRKVIVVEGYRTSVEFDGTRRIDFETKSIGEWALQRATYINTGRRALVVTSVSPLTAPFSIVDVQPSLPAALQPGDTLSVTIRGASIAGSYAATLDVRTTDPCDITVQTQLSIASFARTTLHIPIMHSAVGQTIQVPVILDSVEGVLDTLLHTFHCTVQFRKSMLAPISQGGKPGVSISWTMADSVTVVQCSGPWDGSDTLATIPCMVLLDAERSIVLDLADDQPFAWGEVPTDVIQVDGALDVDDICAGRGLRVVHIGSGLQRVNVSPNPVHEVAIVHYVASSAAEVDVDVLDMCGQPVLVTHHALQEGTQDIPLHVEALDAGVYHIRLRSTSASQSIPIIIVR